MTYACSLFKPALMFGVVAALFLGAGGVQAQIGSGWTQYFPSKQYNSGMQQSQRYSISGNVEHFWTYTTDTDEFPGQDSGPRSEWRVFNDYTTGHQQFQGDLNPENGTSSYTCFQIFGSTTQATSIQLQMRSGNGTLRRYNSEILATGCWGIYTRVNIIHYAVNGTGSIEAWINGSKVGTFADGGYVNHYFKYGVYDTASATSYVGDYWRGASFFSGGTSSGGSADFSLSASPNSLAVVQGNSGNSTIAVNPVNGFSGSVSLSASGLPSGVTASFNPSSTTSTSTLTLTASGTAATGTATVTITGTSGSLTHTTTVSLTVNPAPNFSLSASPNSLTVVQGNSGNSTITVNPMNGFSGSVSLSASGLPGGVTASFNPSGTTSTSTLTLTASSTAATGTATVTITGTSGSLTHTTTVSLTVNPAPDFSLSASPGSVTVTQGSSGNSTITVNPLNGFAGGVSLSASGLPGGVTASFNPSSTTSTSTLTLTAGSTAVTGTATVTITGTSGSLTHTTTISLTVNQAGGGALPAGWSDTDVGAVGLAGSAGYNSGTFTVSGSGADIWNAGDQFNYAYQSVSGDQTIVARVVSENGAASYAKAGVMIRETLATNSVEASVLITPTNGVAMEIRPTTGAASINVAGWVKGPVPPQWLKLVRSGSTFTASCSADGSTWTQIASTNVTMAGSETIGLAVTSHNNASLNTAAFDNVSIAAPASFSGIFQLQNEASGLVLNNQGSLTNGSAITQWNSVTSSNLDWTFIPTSGGYYQINSCKSGLDAVVQGASTANGAGIIQWSFGSSGDDQWKPVQNSDGSYTFFNLNSGLVLEDPASSTNKTTQMDQWSSNGGNNQKWKLLKQ